MEQAANSQIRKEKLEETEGDDPNNETTGAIKPGLDVNAHDETANEASTDGNI